MLCFARLGILLLAAGLLVASDALPDFVMQTSSGPVSFHDVRLAGSGRVSGVATNLGQHKWIGLLADFEVVDPFGKTVGSAPLMFRALDRGQSRKFEDTIQFPDGGKPNFSGYRVSYHTGAIAVKYVLTMVSPSQNRLLEFADQDLQFSFSVSDTSIELKMRNTSRSAVKVIWRGTEFTDVFEQTHLIAHVGGGDSTIAPAGSLKESVEPVGGNSGEYKGWRADSVLPRTQDAGEMTGRSITLSLPVEVEGAQRCYRFVFQVAETLF